jgi:hypothetical protein
MQKWERKLVIIKWLGSTHYLMWHLEMGRNWYNLHKWMKFVQSTKIQHNEIYRETWIIPGTMVINQINVFINRRLHSIKDVKSMQGPNCDTDHALITVKQK